jgi:membrane protease YdiL (CAAX protease family)
MLDRLSLQNKLNKTVPWGPIAAIIVTAGTFFGSQIFAQFLVSAYVAMRGWTTVQATKWINSSTIGQFIIVVLAESFVLVVLWLFLKKRKASFKTLGLITPKLRDIGYALAGFGVYFPLLMLSSFLLHVLAPSLQIDQKQQIGFEAAHGAALILVFISLVIVPPLVEEILVRGFLYSGLKSRLPKLWAALVASLIFAAAHLQFGSGAPLVWSAAMDTFILSLVLIYLREKTDGLWASIFLHMTKNGLAFVVLFVLKSV